MGEVNRARAICMSVGLVAVLWVLYRTAWLCDDAYITLRSVDNVLAGHGLRWNVADRVQVFTHPLWALVLIPTHFFVADPYYATILLSLALGLGAAALFLFFLPGEPRLVLGGAFLLIASKSFVDYSSSGLESPLTHLLLTVFVVAWLPSDRFGLRRVILLVLVASLGVLNRQDTVLLYAPMIAIALWRSEHSWRKVGAVVAGAVPLIAWEAFSLVYYGLLVPNTAYAKLGTGIDRGSLARQGLLYFADSILLDPVTLTVILLAVLLPLAMRQNDLQPLVLGILLYLAYVVWIGGGFMSGRFFAAPYLCAAMVLVRLRFTWRWRGVGVAALIAALAVTAPLTPLFSGRRYGEERHEKNGIEDERAAYFPETGLIWAGDLPFVPDSQWAYDGVAAQEQSHGIYLRSSVGFFGYFAGPEVHIVDTMGLGDPLLSKLPIDVDAGWRIGHFQRPIPQGYAQSLLRDENLIRDPDLALFYRDVRLIARGPIWSADRWRAIWRFHSGQTDGLVEAYASRARPPV